MTFDQWLTTRGISVERSSEIADLVASVSLFETPERIMHPDSWFYFPDNNRFTVLGTAPSGDGIALDTLRDSVPVMYIDHERLHHRIADEERSVQVASTLEDFIAEQLNPAFPLDYREVREK